MLRRTLQIETLKSVHRNGVQYKFPYAGELLMKYAVYIYIILSPLSLFLRFAIDPDSLFLTIWPNIYILLCSLVLFALISVRKVNSLKLNSISMFVVLALLYGVMLIFISIVNGKDAFIAIKGFRDYYLILLFYFLIYYNYSEQKIYKLIYTMMIVAIFSSIFSLVENIYTNIFGGLNKLFWLDRLYMSTEHPTSQYTQGIPIGGDIPFLIRPFGIILQPQINSIFLLFAVILTNYRRMCNYPDTKKIYLKIISYTSLFASLGKTAILLYFIISPLLYKLVRSFFVFLLFIFIFAIVAPHILLMLKFSVDIDSANAMAFINDVRIYIHNNNFFTFIIGNGFDVYDAYYIVREVQFFRLLHYFGLMGVLIYLLPVFYMVKKYISLRKLLSTEHKNILKITLALAIAYWGSTIHYNAFWSNGINTFYVASIAIASIIFKSYHKKLNVSQQKVDS